MWRPTRFPPPGLQRQPGSAAWRRPSDGPSHQGPSPLFGVGPCRASGAGQLHRPLQQPLGRAQRSLGFVDRRHEIVTFGAEVRLGEIADPALVRGDGLGGGAQLGGGRAGVGGYS